MKITILQDSFSKALNHVVKAVSSRPNLPVLSNILIEATKGKVKLSATNLEIGINAWLGAEVEEEGSLTVSAKMLAEFVNSLGSSKITIQDNGQTLKVFSVDNHAEFVVISADDFPAVPKSEKEPSIVLNALDFAKGISKSTVAAAIDESRPVLAGILLESDNDYLKMVGIDGFRLSKVDIVMTKAPEDAFKFIVPAKSLQELERIIKDVATEKDDVEVYLLGDKNQIIFKVNDTELSSRLIEGEFPNYNDIIPKEKTNSFISLKSDLEKSSKIIMIFAKNVIGNKTKFSINATEKKLKLSTSVIDVGNNESSIDVSKVEGESLETAYNARFLLDMISTIEGDEIIYETSGVTAPGLFRDKDNQNYLHIIMPMRLD